MAVSIACLGFISKPDGKPIFACYKNLNLQLKTECDESKLTHQNVVEIFNNKEFSMSTVNFSVPEDVKKRVQHGL